MGLCRMIYLPGAHAYYRFNFATPGRGVSGPLMEDMALDKFDFDEEILAESIFRWINHTVHFQNTASKSVGAISYRNLCTLESIGTLLFDLKPMILEDFMPDGEDALGDFDDSIFMWHEDANGDVDALFIYEQVHPLFSRAFRDTFEIGHANRKIHIVTPPAANSFDVFDNNPFAFLEGLSKGKTYCLVIEGEGPHD